MQITEQIVREHGHEADERIWFRPDELHAAIQDIADAVREQDAQKCAHLSNRAGDAQDCEEAILAMKGTLP